MQKYARLISQPINTTLKDRVSAFAKAGSTLSDFLKSISSNTPPALENDQFETIAKAVQLAQHKNGWFTKDNITHALKQWAMALKEESIHHWLANYKINSDKSNKIGIITAGNIPLVGFHDIACVILTGDQALIKNSSNDDVLTPMLLQLLCYHEPKIKDQIHYVTGKLENYDAVIATGSNNTARYFEHYFSHVPNIIRKNRNSIAILTGNESPEQMEALSEDVFRYFGLGCRSVSHIKVPRNFNFDVFFNGMYAQREHIKFEKYINNYDYNKAVYLMSELELLDNEFLILKEENSSYTSPIASLGYSYYDDLGQLFEELIINASQLQCVVAHENIQEQFTTAFKDLKAPQVVDYGQTQSPSWSDYADGVDTIAFLLAI